MSAYTEKFKAENKAKIDKTIITKRSFKENEKVLKEMRDDPSLRGEAYDDIILKYFAKLSYEVDNGKILAEKIMNLYVFCSTLNDKLPNKYKNIGGLVYRINNTILDCHKEACKYISSRTKGVTSLYNIDGMLMSITDIYTLLSVTKRETAITHKRLEHIFMLCAEIGKILGALIRFANSKSNKYKRVMEFLPNNENYSSISVSSTQYSVFDLLMSMDSENILYSDNQLKKPYQLLSQKEIDQYHNSLSYQLSQIPVSIDDPMNIWKANGDFINARGEYVSCSIEFHNSAEECKEDAIEFFDPPEQFFPVSERVVEIKEDNKQY